MFYRFKPYRPRIAHTEASCACSPFRRMTALTAAPEYYQVPCGALGRYWMGDGNARDGLLYFGVKEPRTTPRPATQSEKDRLFARMEAASPPLKTVVVVVDMQNDYSTSSEAPTTRCAHWLGTTRAMRVLQCGVAPSGQPLALGTRCVCCLLGPNGPLISTRLRIASLVSCATKSKRCVSLALAVARQACRFAT